MYRALIDTGSEASATHLLFLIHKFQKVSFEKYMTSAGDTRHTSLGFGYLKVISNDDNGAPSRFSLVHCSYTPSLQHITPPSATTNRHRHRVDGCTAYKNFREGTGHATLHNIVKTSPDLVFPGVVIRKSLFTEPLVPHS
jgi:hypothetical protein